MPEALIIGETHGALKNQQAYQKWIPDLAKMGYKRLTLELPSNWQGHLDKYLRESTTDESAARDAFQKTISQTSKMAPNFKSKDGVDGRGYLLDLAREANALGMKVDLVDQPDAKLTKSVVGLLQQEDVEKIPPLFQKFVESRSETMARAIEHGDRPCVHIGGFRHTGGERGLESLLADRGVRAAAVDIEGKEKDGSRCVSPQCSTPELIRAATSNPEIMATSLPDASRSGARGQTRRLSPELLRR